MEPFPAENQAAAPVVGRRNLMFWNEHAPPHFHALYGDYEALIDLRDLSTMRGTLPRRAMALVLDWASVHHAELMEDWELCRNLQPPKAIEPLI